MSSTDLPRPGQAADTESRRSPPDPSSGVFYVTGSSTISAPIQKVWKVLLDFDSYHHWNPFVRAQHVVDHTGQLSADKTPRPGKYLSIAPVHLPPTLQTLSSSPIHLSTSHPYITLSSGAFVKIIVLDHTNYEAAWETAGLMPKWLLHSERWQVLKVVNDGNGERVSYSSVEVFYGVVAYIIAFLLGSQLRLGFQAMADTLKIRAEDPEVEA